MMQMRSSLRRLAGFGAALTICAGALGGCSGGASLPNPGEWFASLGDSTSSSRSASSSDVGFTVSRTLPTETAPPPVGPADLVGADGSCQGAAAQPTGAPVGVTLMMTECQLVAVAGQPSHVELGADSGGGRRAVLTYAQGDHPGIYTFVAGRLKVIDANPTAAKPEPKRPARARKRKT